MRVAYDASPLLNPLTGVGHYALSLLEHMLEEDHEVSFDLMAVTFRADTSRVPAGDRIRLRHFRFPARFAVRWWERLGRPKADQLVGEPDLFHGTNFWVPPLSRPIGVVTIHDLTFLLFPEMCTPQVQRYRHIVPAVLNRCALVLTPSNTVKEQVSSELGFPSDRIVVTPEGVRSSFVGAKQDPTALSRIGVGSEYVLFIGTQEPRKNLDRLIQAFASVPEPFQLVIAGPPGWGSVDLGAVAHKLGLHDRVVFSGYLPDEVLGALMAGARSFAFPTLYEGFGLPPLEAMAAGVPVVASRAGSLPEVLGDGPFYCDPLDIGSIADALVRSLEDGSQRELAIKAGIERAASFSWSQTARLTLEAYALV